MVSKRLLIVAAVQVGVLLHVVFLRQLISTKQFVVLGVGAAGAFALYHFYKSRKRTLDRQQSDSKGLPSKGADTTDPTSTAKDTTAAEPSSDVIEPKAVLSSSQDSSGKAAGAKMQSRKKGGRSTLKKSGTSSSWNANEVIPGLFVGDKKAAMNKEELKQRNISHIVSLFGAPVFPDDFKYLTLELLDSPSEDLLQKFPHTNQFIDEGRAEGSVLVHCEKGISRSATVVIAYIMYSMKKTFDEATDIVMNARAACLPNYGFLTQLKLYEGMGFELEGTSEAHKKYVVFKLGARAAGLREKWLGKTAHTPDFALVDELARDPVDGDGRTLISCRQCQNRLFSTEDTISHEKGQDTLVDASTMPDCNSIFIYPVRWMAPLIKDTQEGTLNCPQCNAEVGRFDWGGVSAPCSCQFRFKPAFRITKDAVQS